jgi:hypothetical protein
MTNLIGDSNTWNVPAIKGTSSTSAAGVGVMGESLNTTTSNGPAGVQGNAMAGIGVYGTSSTGPAIMGESGSVAVLGKNYVASGKALQAWQTGSAGYGVYSQATASNGVGVYSSANTAIQAVGTALGISASASASNSTAISASVSASGSTAVYALNSSSLGFAIYAANTAASPYAVIWGDAYGDNTPAVYGAAGGVNSAGIYGHDNGTSSYAGYFIGKVTVTGYLAKSGGGFLIDHPQDPANKFLYHHFVESPDMKNIYDGVAVLDEKGSATIGLPGYFEATNSDFRYQLTAMGKAMPELHVSSEVKGCSFAIAGGVPGGTISWMVTGIRADKWAKENHPGVEVEKVGEEKGLFIHPHLEGFGKDKAIQHHERNPMIRPAHNKE